MHLLSTTGATLDELIEPVDLGQPPGDLVVLSFADSDLSALAAAWAAERNVLPSVRLAQLRDLRHPMSVDLWIDSVACHAKAILVRLIGGIDWWRYGVERLAATARANGIKLALLPGEDRDDPRLAEASTLPRQELDALLRYFREGGRENLRALLRRLAGHAGVRLAVPEPHPVPRLAAYLPAEGAVDIARLAAELPAGRPAVIIVFYRALLLAADMSALDALCAALAERGLAPAPLAVTSLKEDAAAAFIRDALGRLKPAVIVTTTAFAAGGDSVRPTPFDGCDAPVLQAVIATTKRTAWRNSPRGLGAADLAMHVVLPELDGRVLAGAVAFKDALPPEDGLHFTALGNRPEAECIAAVADRVAALVHLRATPRAQRRIAILMPDYPGAPGRAGYAVGLDVPASVVALLADLATAGYAVGDTPQSPRALLDALVVASPAPRLPLDAYGRLCGGLGAEARAKLHQSWGDPADDPDLRDGAFQFRAVVCGNAIIALPPDRGRPDRRRADYHDAALPPRHGLVAFWLWLRLVAKVQAVVHTGAHGTLEWLPGKAVALTGNCFPEALVGALPVVYPFIVSNPGEAAQAKRRIAAVTIGHLPPPLVANSRVPRTATSWAEGAGTNTTDAHAGTASEHDLSALERLVDEFAQADGLDAKRRDRLGRLIIDTARRSGLAREAGLDVGGDPAEALRRIDTWLCDLKDLAIKDGLHIYGRECPPVARMERAARNPGPPWEVHEPSCLAATVEPSSPDCRTAKMRSLHPGYDDACEADPLRQASAAAERAALLAALDGARVAPGPAGAPSRGRTDVLPTGRNLFTADPRMLPTPTAMDLGRLAADEVIRGYLQMHGEMPRALILDLWGSATLRTGGEEIAQGLALMGARPTWDHATGRVTGIEVLAPAAIGRPRVDVTWRISGLFRDLFPAQIALIDAAVRAIASRTDADDDNPLAATWREAGGDDKAAPARIFSAAPGAYGAGVEHLLGSAADQAVAGAVDRAAIGAAYLAAADHAYGDVDGAAVRMPDEFAARVVSADLLVHPGDDPGRDLLEGAEDAAFVGGFAAAAASLGRSPDLIMLDSTDPQRPRARPLSAALARIVRGRAIDPRFIAGQMRHGPRGAAELAETVDRLVDFAATTGAVASTLIDLVHDAYIADPAVRHFLLSENPAAAREIACRLDAARRAGCWHPRRNDVDSDLRSLMAEAAQ